MSQSIWQQSCYYWPSERSSQQWSDSGCWLVQASWLSSSCQLVQSLYNPPYLILYLDTFNNQSKTIFKISGHNAFKSGFLGSGSNTYLKYSHYIKMTQLISFFNFLKAVKVSSWQLVLKALWHWDENIQFKSVLSRSFPVQINTGDKVTFLWLDFLLISQTALC